LIQKGRPGDPKGKDHNYSTKVVEDVKGMETREFIIKKKLFMYIFPYLELRLVK